MNNTIRRRENTDIPALMALWRRSVEATHRFLTPADVDMLEPDVRQALEMPDVWVVDRDGAPAGFMVMADNAIEALFIDPVHRGKRLGSGFVDFAKKIGGDGAEIRVDVNEDNPDALAFYLARGFRRVGRSPVDASGRPWPLLHLLLDP